MSADWTVELSNFRDFVIQNRRYPTNNKDNNVEKRLFLWAKSQRAQYTKRKLESDKVEQLNNCDIWYFDSKSKSSMLKKIQNIENKKTKKMENTVKQLQTNDHVAIDITNLNYYTYDETHQDIDFVNKTTTLQKIVNTLISFIPKYNDDKKDVV